MLFTIVIPTKNSEATIKYALGSILTQKVPKELKFELIIVDGYSKDRTLDIIANYVQRLRKIFRENFVRYVVLQENIGIGYARNLALREAKGDWIIWVDSDNILSSDYLESVVKELNSLKNDKIALLYPYKVRPLYQEHNKWSKILACYGLTQEIIKHTPIQGSLPYTAMQGTVCNTHILRRIGGFNSKLIAAEDIDLFLRLIRERYGMKPFRATLYYLARTSLKSWFIQAMTWEYGKRLLQQYAQVNYSIGYGNKGSYIMRHILTIFSLLTKGVHNCGITSLLFPLLYIYRRAGFIKGRMY